MKSPRVQVSLDPVLHDAIRRIALGTNQSASGLISSMLANQRDVLCQVASAVDKARSLSGALSVPLTMSLAKGEADAERIGFEAQANLDVLNDSLAREIDVTSGRSGSGGRGAEGASGWPERDRPDPLPINKGVFNKGVKSE